MSYDFLVIGSGIAGLRAALALVPHGRVLIITKADPDAGSTGFAQGGIAAAVGADDSPDLHAADTIGAGDGLCDAAAVEVLVGEGPRYVHELIEWGAAFDRDSSGRLALAREAAHSVRRVLHARDATGREIARTLGQRLRGDSNLTVRDHCVATRALVEDGVVRGARFVDASGATGEARARATLVATGGAGHVFRETTNPPVATGDGVALAFLAGARVADLEFVQFHPTALNIAGAPRHLLSEALRGEGARLINNRGERFMSRYEAAQELAPRDRVARAIVREAERTGATVCLTMAHLPPAEVRAKFPLITELCRSVGLDLATDPIPVSPAAHYVMGGIKMDLEGRTSLPGLFAAGEAACTGVHGANRLASNSLLEGLVFGARAGAAMRAFAGNATRGTKVAFAKQPPSPSSDPSGDSFTLPIDEAEIRALMWSSAGIFRDREGLTRVLSTLDPLWQIAATALDAGARAGVETWRKVSLVTAGRLIARGAIRREESRGAHSRTDFPARDDVHFQRQFTDIRE